MPHALSSSSAVNAADLEVALSLDDVNIELVSSHQAPPPVQPLRPEELSIDDFVIASSSPDEVSSRKVTKPRDEWYVNVLRQELGPLPFDELVRMAAEGDIDPQDFLRHGKDGTWIPAAEIQGLFVASSAPPADAQPSTDASSFDDGDDFELGVKMDDTLPSRAPQGPREFRAIGGNISRVSQHQSPLHPLQAVQTSSEKPSNPQNPVVVAKSVPSAVKAAVEPAPAQSTREPESAVDAELQRKQKLAARLNAWLSEQKPELAEPIPAVASAANAAAEEQSTAATAGTSRLAGLESDDFPASAAWSGVFPSVPGAESGTANSVAAARPMPVIRPVAKGKSSSGGSLFSGGMPDWLTDPKVLGGVAVALLLGAVLIFAPNKLLGVNEKAIYARFLEIHAEVGQARSNPQMLDSKKEALISELNSTLKKLENAGTGVRARSRRQLYQAGKYCLVPLLQTSDFQNTLLDDAFHTRMQFVCRQFGDSVPPPPAPESHQANSL